ncbi:MAG: HK97-gp10 family putative phage morphogenesis protein [Cetobacterium sp.]|uniref:HK97-gp10 family putative phage morphogenesis protein n=1 Tax=Cetobacterium sp. TaxID=2071632 RepID=UPI003F3390FF
MKGLEEFQTALKRISREMREENEKMLKRAGLIAVKNIKLVTPVDTGELRQNNKSVVTDTNEVSVFNNTPYAGHVEWGTKKQAGQFYIKRGLDNSGEEIVRMVKRTVRRVLK